MSKQQPLKATAEHLASKGRYGDTMLVHMNPIEVAGIASLTPGGLTTNPDTGQPEAFAFLLPLLASGMGTAMGLGTLGTAALSGGLTAAVTGDLKRGIAAGIMGAGVGNALGSTGASAADAAAATATGATEAVTTGMADALTTAGTDAALSASAQAMTEAEMAAAMGQLGAETAGQGMAGLTDMSAAIGGAATPPPALTGKELFQSDQFSMGDRAKMMFNDQTMGNLMKPQNMLPIAMGGGQLETLEAQEDWEKQADEIAKRRKEDQQKYYDDLQRAYAAAQPNAMRGLSPARAGMSSNMPPPWRPGMAHGGIVTMPGGGPVPGHSSPYYDPEGVLGGGYGNRWNNFGSRGGNPGYGGIDPVTIQKNLRGQSVAPPPGYVAGFNPEMRYFQNLEEGQAPSYPQFTAPHLSSQQMYAGSPINRFLQDPNASYFENILPPAPTPAPQEKNPTKVPSQKPDTGLAAGGEVPMNTSAGPVSVAGGGIANLPQESFGPPQGQEPAPEDIQMLAAALEGQMEPAQADQVVNGFIERYGVDMFRAVRDQVLKKSAPNAQTEGMVKGQGGGMDDQVPGMIGNNQPVAVSPGEFIVPADVVSGIGDGSSDAGAAQLEQMMGNVRQARQGGQMQPPPINAAAMMPR